MCAVFPSPAVLRHSGIVLQENGESVSGGAWCAGSISAPARGLGGPAGAAEQGWSQGVERLGNGESKAPAPGTLGPHPPQPAPGSHAPPVTTAAPCCPQGVATPSPCVPEQHSRLHRYLQELSSEGMAQPKHLLVSRQRLDPAAMRTIAAFLSVVQVRDQAAAQASPVPLRRCQLLWPPPFLSVPRGGAAGGGGGGGGSRPHLLRFHHARHCPWA